MIKATVVRAIGNSSGIVIPKPMLDGMHISRGDTIYAIEVVGGVLLTRVDPASGEMWEAYRDGMRRYRGAMKKLAGE